MKKLTIVTVIAVCLVLCAVAWPQATPTQAVSATLSPAATVTQPEAPAAPEIEELIAPEVEKIAAPHSETAHGIISEPEPAPDPMPAVPETQVIAEPEPAPEDAPMASEVQTTPEPDPTPISAPSQTVTDPQTGDMVYVPGFGWLECQGPGEVIYDTKIYENGNKIGVMG